MFTVAVLPGDGIGPEVIDEAVKVLDAVTDQIDYSTLPVGLESIKKYGKALTDENLDICKSCGAILFGAVGGAEGDMESHPRDSLGKLRKKLDLYANFRPITFFSEQLCRVKDVKRWVKGKKECDILIVRELTSGVYFTEREKLKDSAYDMMSYTRSEIERIAHVAFREAEKRNNKVTSVAKENVLACSQLWKEIVTDVAAQYADSVTLSHMFADTCAMKLLVSPEEFDVILTGNLFGDILSDEASLLSGSIGLLPSASYNYEKNYALFEPVHGSAPDLKKGEANPIGAILSGALMLEYLGLSKEKEKIYTAVHSVLQKGYHTTNMRGTLNTVVTTKKMGTLIKEAIS